MVYKALDIANKILGKASELPGGELISNMKLQKMLYYMQGFHLAYFGEPLFDEDIEAWQYGPVVPSVYNHFCEYKSNGISPSMSTFIQLDKEEENLFNEVFRVYGEYSAIGLMNMTHNESPWKETQTGKGQVITKEKLKNFFKTQLK
ncbi:type II toxin-antitoxin system antitoxin SocA domain-containing protein [Dysgonomonas capnocytophagoides]|uniref:Panacea domain-containing protein n=1 Tax=Dysgonomonas capnocytophagoides TaxID=45254 RepID=UPI002A80F40C|nr:type II toxin-antitoxin system antitoxin SocA domain-containing protein [Dysgonomonas capnocytophagoides]